MKQSLFEAVGGLPVLERVHTTFYDKVYAHPWLGKFFEGHDQQVIELRQTQFMAEKFGLEVPYPGRDLELAHRRMYLTEELLELRKVLLHEALEEETVPVELITRWLKIDGAFWSKLKKDSLAAFKKIDLKYQKPLIVDKPENL